MLQFGIFLAYLLASSRFRRSWFRLPLDTNTLKRCMNLFLRTNFAMIIQMQINLIFVENWIVFDILDAINVLIYILKSPGFPSNAKNSRYPWKHILSRKSKFLIFSLFLHFSALKETGYSFINYFQQ